MWRKSTAKYDNTDIFTAGINTKVLLFHILSLILTKKQAV